MSDKVVLSVGVLIRCNVMQEVSDTSLLCNTVLSSHDQQGVRNMAVAFISAVTSDLTAPLPTGSE